MVSLEELACCLNVGCLMILISYFFFTNKPVVHHYAQGKTDTETNFVVTVGFTTKVDHQTTSKSLVVVEVF